MANKKKMGRPPKDIDKKMLETISTVVCMYSPSPRKDIVDIFDVMLGGCSDDTIENFIKKNYTTTDENGNEKPLTFSEFVSKRKNFLKMKVARAGLNMMEKSGAVLIFLMKNVLGMTDKIEEVIKNGGENLKIEVSYTDEADENGNAEN